MHGYTFGKDWENILSIFTSSWIGKEHEFSTFSCQFPLVPAVGSWVKTTTRRTRNYSRVVALSTRGPEGGGEGLRRGVDGLGVGPTGKAYQTTDRLLRRLGDIDWCRGEMGSWWRWLGRDFTVAWNATRLRDGDRLMNRLWSDHGQKVHMRRDIGVKHSEDGMRSTTSRLLNT